MFVSIIILTFHIFRNNYNVCNNFDFVIILMFHNILTFRDNFNISQ